MTHQHSKPAFAVPPGACDCHMHVYGPLAAYPAAPQRSYTPREASLADYLDMAGTLGLERVVFVQGSAYGSDNRCLKDTLRALGASGRGVAVIDRETPDSELAALHAAGVRGARVNAETFGLRSAADVAGLITQTAERLRPFGWHLQLFAALPTIADLYPVLNRLPVPLVIDHMGMAQAARGTDQPGFDRLLALLSDGAWVKVSGAYRVSSAEPGFADAAVIARALIAANPERIVWGSDWPHTGKHANARRETAPLIDYRPLDDGRLLDLLAGWVDGDAALLQRILTDNPAALYGFAEGARHGRQDLRA